ncbi:MAG: cation:proton antiporter [Dehalococcoidia bacterium]|nr:cation:proton antiporter [Dehalococcoidia bacterium]MSQ17341.1 cation:proton antiporter [Dehalococcoidia bacterium]
MSHPAISLFSIPTLVPAAETAITQVILLLLLQLAVILLAAKVAGELALRLLHAPPVLAELAAGVLIGPYALGGAAIPGFGPLFPLPAGAAAGGLPVGSELFALAQLGSIVLLFRVGLETNLRQFLTYAGPATAVALGGVAAPFALGVAATVLFGFAGPAGIWSPEALFMGAILTATSVGITARVLDDLHRLESPEGMVIIAAAVVDDVLGILVLTVVAGISIAGGGFSWGGVGWVAFKAVGFWLGLSGLGILAASRIERAIGWFRVPGAAVALTLALALLAAGLAQVFGLAFIIGAFSMGLALSTTELGHRTEKTLAPVADLLVPVFFVTMGMLVDVGAMRHAVVFGLIISALAIIGKAFGAGLPALATGFNLRGSLRIGAGMAPRGEVALIIAGIGLSQGIIGQDLFGVSIMMTVITTIAAPLALAPLFRWPGSGRRGDATAPPR